MAMLRHQTKQPYNEMNRKCSTAIKTKSNRQSLIGTGGSKYNQMKRKSTGSRQKMTNCSRSVPKTLPHDFMSSSCRGLDGFASTLKSCHNDNSNDLRVCGKMPINKSRQDSRVDTLNRSQLSDTVYNIDDDYRKNLFGTQASRKTHTKNILMDDGSKKRYIDDEDEIVNKAFSRIFKEYCDDEGNNSNEMSIENNGNENSGYLGHPGAYSYNDKPENTSTLVEIFEFTGNPSSSSPSITNARTGIDFNYTGKKEQSSTDPPLPPPPPLPSYSGSFSDHYYHHPHQLRVQHLNEHSKHLTNFNNDNENFLRGSTVSKSFIKNVKSRSINTGTTTTPTTTTSPYKNPKAKCDDVYNRKITSKSGRYHQDDDFLEDDDSKNVTENGNYSNAIRDGNFLMDTSTIKKKGPGDGGHITKPPIIMKMGSLAMNTQKRSKSSSEMVDEQQKQYFNKSQNISLRKTKSISGDGGGVSSKNYSQIPSRNAGRNKFNEKF